jgi:hypothetical protein
MANPNISEIITTTIESRSGTLADNVTQNTALLFRLRERGRVKPVSGGNVIRQELAYAENGTYTRYSGYDNLNISPSDVFTSAEFNWKQAAVAVSINGLEMLQNSGKEEVIDLLESRIENAEQTMVNSLSADCYSDGTASGGKQVGGLQLLVADLPTSGTVGGIDRATWTFWQNQRYDFSVQSVTPSATTIQAAMNTLYLACSRNTDRPDLIVADNTYYTYYWSSLQTIQRITNTKLGEAGFDNLKFMGADVVPDGGLGGDAPSSHMYFLNTKYIHFRPHRNRTMVALGPDRYATNQDATVKLIGWAGNMTLSNASLQGVICA